MLLTLFILFVLTVIRANLTDGTMLFSPTVVVFREAIQFDRCNFIFSHEEESCFNDGITTLIHPVIHEVMKFCLEHSVDSRLYRGDGGRRVVVVDLGIPAGSWCGHPELHIPG